MDKAVRQATGMAFLETDRDVQIGTLLALGQTLSGNAPDSTPALRQADELVKEADEKLSVGEYKGCVDSLNEALDFFMAAGSTENARSVAKRSMDIAERELGNKHASFAQCLNNWAITSPKDESPKTIKGLHKRALKIRGQALGKRHEKCAESLSNLAHFRHRHGKVKEAIRLYREAVSIYRETVPESDGDRQITESRLEKLLASQE